MDENKFLERITFHPRIFGGKPIIRGRRLAAEQRAAGHDVIWAGDWSEDPGDEEIIA